MGNRSSGWATPPGDSSTVKASAYLERRREQGFSVIQAVTLSEQDVLVSNHLLSKIKQPSCLERQLRIGVRSLNFCGIEAGIYRKKIVKLRPVQP